MIVNGNREDIPLPVGPPDSPPYQKPWKVSMYVPATVGVPSNIGVVNVLVDVVASSSPPAGPVMFPPFGCTVVNERPGGITPLIFQEPIVIKGVIVKPSGVMGTPTSA